jgi:tRNA pseudouridine55 synthase
VPVNPLTGVLVVNKPRGVISKDVSRLIERRFGSLKLGHVGTLDPSAEGVLPILFGRATKIQDHLLELPKTYEFVVKFGFETDTLDLDGQVIKSDGRSEVSNEEIEAVLSQFRGNITQLPPLYSAVKLRGKPLYEYARRGVDVSDSIDKMARQIFISDFVVMEHATETTKFSVTCSKGTYVRCLARDLAAALGTYATVTTICRTKAAGFSIDQAVSWEMLNSTARVEDLVIPLDRLDLGMPCFQLSGRDQTIRLRQGQKLLVPAGDFAKSLNMPMDSLALGSLRSLYLRDELGAAFGFAEYRMFENDTLELRLRKGF